jgi:hypothetical protein
MAIVHRPQPISQTIHHACFQHHDQAQVVLDPDPEREGPPRLAVRYQPTSGWTDQVLVNIYVCIQRFFCPKARSSCDLSIFVTSYHNIDSTNLINFNGLLQNR